MQNSARTIWQITYLKTNPPLLDEIICLQHSLWEDLNSVCHMSGTSFCTSRAIMWARTQDRQLCLMRVNGLGNRGASVILILHFAISVLFYLSIYLCAKSVWYLYLPVHKECCLDLMNTGFLNFLDERNCVSTNYPLVYPLWSLTYFDVIVISVTYSVYYRRGSHSNVCK